MKELKVPVRLWVPDWLGLVAIFVVILPVMMLNGSYTGSVVEVSGTLGTNSEDITMGYYAASAGLAIAYPIVSKVLEAVSVKFLLLVDLILQFFLSWMCARSQTADVLIVCSFLIGFLKGFLLMWFTRYAKFIFSPKDVRSEFYAYYYPMVFTLGQISMLLTAELAYYYNWKYMYYFMMILILVAILFVIICFRHNHADKPVPISQLHIREIIIISAGMLMLAYFINYGKVLDWMDSSKLRIYMVVAPLLIATFVWSQWKTKNPYVSLAPLLQPKAIVGYFYMMLVMFFSTSTTLLTNYLTTILKVDTTHTYSLYVWLIPGYVVGAVICFWFFRWQRWRFRRLIGLSMLCFTIFFGVLYFGISPNATYEMLYLPIFFRGLGMLVLIIAFALFAIEDMNPKDLSSNAFFLILFRSVLAPIMATAFYSNILYNMEQKYMYSLSETVTTADPLAASQYEQSLHTAISQGHGFSEATQLATNSLYLTLQQQSLLLALKEILGYLVAVSLVVAVVSFFIPFHKTVRVTFAKTGDDMV